jgi:hypothetical protein
VLRKMRGTSRLAEQLLVSQDRFCYVGLLFFYKVLACKSLLINSMEHVFVN